MFRPAFVAIIRLQSSSYLPSMVSAFQDLYSTDILLFSRVWMLNHAEPCFWFEVKHGIISGNEGAFLFRGSVITTGCSNKQKPGRSGSLWQLSDLKTALQGKLRLYKSSSAECDVIHSAVSRNLTEAKKFGFFNNNSNSNFKIRVTYGVKINSFSSFEVESKAKLFLCRLWVNP